MCHPPRAAGVVFDGTYVGRRGVRELTNTPRRRIRLREAFARACALPHEIAGDCASRLRRSARGDRRGGADYAPSAWRSASTTTPSHEAGVGGTVGEAVAEGEAVAVAEVVAVAVVEGVGEAVPVADGLAVDDAVGVGLSRGVWEGVAVRVAVADRVGVVVRVGVMDRVGVVVRVGVRVLVPVRLGVRVGAGVDVSVGVSVGGGGIGYTASMPASSSASTVAQRPSK